MSTAFTHFQAFFAHYGLAAVFVLILIENFGVPLPGELALLYAGYQMRVDGLFGLPALIATGSAASFAGQTIGYAAGRWGSPWLRRVFTLAPRRVASAEAFFERHGSVTIVFSRFVAGIRVLAGPLAGLCHMSWRRFLTFNAIGAVAWVATLASAGWLLGAHWRRLVQLVGHADLAIIAVAVAVILYKWHQRQKEKKRA
jgi:membrane protein DedA with SNARE-associated domain